MNSPNRKIERVVIVGGGTAGLLAAAACRTHFDETIDVTVVRSSKLGVIGVGEGTIPSVVQFLHRFLGISHLELHSEVKPTIKLGIKYFWGNRDYFAYTFSGQMLNKVPGFQYAPGFYCDDDFRFANSTAAFMEHDTVCLRTKDGRPMMHPNYAYHFENEALVNYLEKLTDRLGVTKIDGLIENVDTDEHGVERLRLAGGQIVAGDFFVDCSGFRSLLLGQALSEPVIEFREALFCDRAVVGGWDRTDEPFHPYTTAETMQSGWSWQIEHDTCINRGYVFASDFISDDEAEAEFRNKNPKLKETRVVPFPAGVRKNAWIKNVVALGNAVGFVEPLEATAIGMICDGVLSMVNALRAANYRILQEQRTAYNRIHFENWEIIRDFLALHYKYNTRFQTPFWQAAHRDVQLGKIQGLVDYYRQVGPDFSLLNVEMKRDFFTAEGYLVMLVGQSVEQNSSVKITEFEKIKWQSYIANLDARAKIGMPMKEYLEYCRQHPVNLDQTHSNRARVGEATPTGALNWH